MRLPEEGRGKFLLLRGRSLLERGGIIERSLLMLGSLRLTKREEL